MRFLAVTADDAAQGRVTEADAVVGRISTGGTIDFIVFAALFFGLASGAIYLLIRRWLPTGRLGGIDNSRDNGSNARTSRNAIADNRRPPNPADNAATPPSAAPALVDSPEVVP